MSCLGHLNEFLKLLLELSIAALFPDNLGWEQISSRCIRIFFVFNFHGSLFLSGVSSKWNQLWSNKLKSAKIWTWLACPWLSGRRRRCQPAWQARRRFKVVYFSISKLQIMQTFFLLVEVFCQQIVAQRASRHKGFSIDINLEMSHLVWFLQIKEDYIAKIVFH